MLKLLIVFALVLFAFSVHGQQQAKRCPRTCRSHVPSRELCAAENRGISCHRMNQCQFQNENCRRRGTSRLQLIEVNIKRCRNLARNGSGACAMIRKPRNARPDCKHLRCMAPSNKLSCYRTKRNHCILLNYCQMTRYNCQRDPQNLLQLVNARQCSGMRQGLAGNCKRVHKSD